MCNDEQRCDPGCIGAPMSLVTEAQEVEAVGILEHLAREPGLRGLQALIGVGDGDALPQVEAILDVESRALRRHQPGRTPTAPEYDATVDSQVPLHPGSGRPLGSLAVPFVW
jgi:hypothetical protein